MNNIEAWMIRAKTFESYKDSAEVWENKCRDLEAIIERYRFVCSIKLIISLETQCPICRVVRPNISYFLFRSHEKTECANCKENTVNANTNGSKVQ